MLRAAPAHPVSVYITAVPSPTLQRRPVLLGCCDATHSTQSPDSSSRVLRSRRGSRACLPGWGSAGGRGAGHVSMFISSRQACSAQIGFQRSGLAPARLLSAQAQCSLYVRYLLLRFALSFGPLFSPQDLAVSLCLRLMVLPPPSVLLLPFSAKGLASKTLFPIFYVFTTCRA